MKLRPLVERILNEIGDSKKPPSASYVVTKRSGQITFNFLNQKYEVTVRFPVFQEDNLVTKVGISTDFDVLGNSYQMTNNHEALKLISYVIGGLEEWMSRYVTEFKTKLEIVYIMFNPQSEESEDWNETDLNKRDRVYRFFIQKFAKKYNSTVAFTSSGNISAKFSPHIIIATDTLNIGNA